MGGVEASPDTNADDVTSFIYLAYCLIAYRV